MWLQQCLSLLRKAQRLWLVICQHCHICMVLTINWKWIRIQCWKQCDGCHVGDRKWNSTSKGIWKGIGLKGREIHKLFSIFYQKVPLECVALSTFSWQARPRTASLACFQKVYPQMSEVTKQPETKLRQDWKDPDPGSKGNNFSSWYVSCLVKYSLFILTCLLSFQ